MLFHHKVFFLFLKKLSQQKNTMYTTSSFAKHPVGILAGEKFLHPVGARTILLRTIIFFGKIPVGVYRKNEN
jgi:hypothetical protein